MTLEIEKRILVRRSHASQGHMSSMCVPYVRLIGGVWGFLRKIAEPDLYSGGIPVRLRYYSGIVLRVYIKVI